MGDSLKKQQPRQLRERKQRKLYTDDWNVNDDEIEGRRGFSLQDKLESPRFSQNQLFKEMHGTELTLAYVQRYGFNTPLLFKETIGLGLRVPNADFTIGDVRMNVGSRRILDVMDVNTQKNFEMTMKEWHQYYDNPRKDRLLNVISLEFSHTKLEQLVQSPTIVRQIDWVDVVWPRHLKEAQTEATNRLDDMMYPKVQKYCLMSVKGCYTDFHVDFGGTSVWYHILKGCKVFWLIPPTATNLKLYEQWVLSGKQADVFFGDTVETCCRITLHQGNTFFIPTGWIHAVYTPRDSLVFGGNFLHSYGIEKQLQIAQVEDNTRVPQKFRYPFFTEMLWYVLERYVFALFNRSHLVDAVNTDGTKSTNNTPDQITDLTNGEKVDDDALKKDETNGKLHVHLTKQELHGLKEIVMYLHALPFARKNVPDLIKDPVALITDVRTLVGLHRNDNKDLAITGLPILKPPDDKTAINRVPFQRNSVTSGNILTPPKHPTNHFNSSNTNRSFNSVSPSNGLKRANDSYEKNSSLEYSSNDSQLNSSNSLSGMTSPPSMTNAHDRNGPRRRRTRCKKCAACQRSDCGECSFCLDMVKFGGPGRAKQTCSMRQCLQPMLPVTATCKHCNLDGWGQTPVVPLQKGAGQVRNDGPSSLMECSVCYEITHPSCVQRIVGQANGVINEDMPNSWECPPCCKAGKNTDYKPRHFRARQKSTDIRRMSISSDASSVHVTDDVDHSAEHHAKMDVQTVHQNVPSNPNNSTKLPEQQKLVPTPHIPARSASPLSPPSLPNKRRKIEETDDRHANPRHQRNQLAQQIINNSSKLLRRPIYVVRPASLPPHPTFTGGHLIFDKRVMIPVFKYLAPNDLFNCSLVCKEWSRLTIEPVLWTKMDFTGPLRPTADILRGISRRQPRKLILDWNLIVRRQLAWLLAHLPGLRELHLQGVAAQTALALRTCVCPPLQVLNLSFMTGLNDSVLRDILSPPSDSRPGIIDNSSKLKHLLVLNLSGTDISDISLRYVAQYLPQLKTLMLSSCARVSDMGVAQLTDIASLGELDLSHCKLITETTLEHLNRCKNLMRLDLRHVPQVTTQAVIKFAAKSPHDLTVLDVKLVDKRKVNA